MAFSHKELEDMKPVIDRTVTKFLGFKEPTLVTAAIKCLSNGHSQDQTATKLTEILDEEKAGTFAERLFLALDDYKLLTKLERNRKRREKVSEEVSGSKKKRFDDVVPQSTAPSPGQLTADKIKEMMANAQRVIQERKLQLNFDSQVAAPAPPQPAPPAPETTSQQLMKQANEKAQKAADMHSRIQAQMAKAGLSTMPLQTHGMGFTAQAAQVFGNFGLKGQGQAQKPTPLILDQMGRTIDAQTGETVKLTQHMPTLKANIRAKKREQFKAVQDKPPEEITESQFFDPRVSGKGAVRSKRGFKFHEQGKFESIAQRLRTKAQLDRLQMEIAHTAKRTGIASASKLAAIAPKKDLMAGEVPTMEWWDNVLTQVDSYEAACELDLTTLEGITHLVEHPIQMRPPAEPDKTIQMPVFLTKRERKKLRRQNRMETQKELTEKIRLGLMPPPEPKVRMANLMRVLGTEAVQDPTKVEAHVRAQMAKRQRLHNEANAARKLSKEEKREKKARKLKEDTSHGVHVSVYRVNELSHPSKKFKVEMNANQLYMTGIVVLHRDCNVVVVEGGPKQQKKFRRLMLNRIKWDEDNQKSKKLKEDSEKVPNKCCLVWEGTVKNRAFGEMKFKACPTESFAREQFRKCNAEHYWNSAYSGAILEMAAPESL